MSDAEAPGWEGPLGGIRVLDLTRVLAGPAASLALADLGAEVIKIEPPGSGDETRTFPPFRDGESHYYLAINRGKKSIVVDLKTEAGRGLVLDLVEEPGAGQRGHHRQPRDLEPLPPERAAHLLEVGLLEVGPDHEPREQIDAHAAHDAGRFHVLLDRGALVDRPQVGVAHELETDGDPPQTDLLPARDQLRAAHHRIGAHVGVVALADAGGGDPVGELGHVVGADERLVIRQEHVGLLYGTQLLHDLFRVADQVAPGERPQRAVGALERAALRGA